MQVARWSGDYLRGKGVENGRLNAEYLMAHVLGMDRLQLYLQFDRPLTEPELAAFRPLLKRRAGREPLQYLLGTAPFRNVELNVDPRVAIPRPETEYLIDVLIRVTGDKPRFASALDVGTGSGALAIALADEGLARRVTATDFSVKVLEVARSNASDCGHPEIEFRHGWLLDPVADRTFDLVVSNPPYLSEAEWRATEPEVRRWEPRGAMVADEAGLALVRELATGVAAVLQPGGWFGVEVGSAQAELVGDLLSEGDAFRSIGVHQDLTGRPRYVFAERLST